MADPERPQGSQDPTRRGEGDLRGEASRTEDLAGSSGSVEPGPKRLGDFELFRELGRGGMGVVYEARQVSLKRRVALKVLPPAVGLTQQARRRFEREAQAAAKLHHTNIVPVHAIGEDDGHHFYAMDLIEGQSLDHVLRELVNEGPSALLAETVTRAGSELSRQPRSSSESKPATTSAGDSLTSLGDTSAGSRPWFDTVAKLIAEVADALDCAHGRGVIHRDIKPANLMLSNEGRLCITDFGLARIMQEPGMTVSGAFLGTPAYMSPEQIAAGRVKLDHRTDVYSLGAVLYELLTLQRPFVSESREEVLSAILAKEPRAPRKLNSKIPQDLETICLKALEKDPDRRYPTAGSLSEDLRHYLRGGLIAARRASPMRRAGKWIRRHPAASTAMVAAVLLALFGGLAWRFAAQRAGEHARRTVAEARFEMERGQYRSALVTVDEALAIDPDLVEGRLIRARLLMKLDRTPEAVAEARRLLEHGPDNWAAHLILVALAKGKDTSAAGQVPTLDVEQHVEFVEAQAPQTADAYYIRSLVADSATAAVKLLDRALELDPGHPESLVERIHRREKLKNYPAALQDCERLIGLRPRSAQGHRRKAWLLSNWHDYLGALAEMRRAVELDPLDPRSYDGRGWALANLGKLGEAVEDYTYAIGLNSSHAPFYANRGVALSRMGRFQEAIQDGLRAVELNSDCVEAYVPLLRGLLRLGKEEELREWLSRLKAVADGWIDPAARVNAYAGASFYYHALGDRDQALAEAARAVEVAADAPSKRRGLHNRAWIRRQVQDEVGKEADCVALADLDLHDPQERLLRAIGLADVCSRFDLTLAETTRLIEEHPTWAAPYGTRTRARVRLGEMEAALADATRAIELAPRSAEAYLIRYVIYERMHRAVEALADAHKTVELAPYNAGYRFGRGESNLYLGRIDDAAADYEKALALDPLHGSAYTGLARVQAVRGECAEASENLRRAEELASRTAEWGNLAYTHLYHFVHDCPNEYDPTAALNQARLAAKRSPGDPAWTTLLGAALFRNGRHEEAKEFLQRSVKNLGSATTHELFPLAMVAWHQGEHPEARTHYDRGVAWMREHEPNNPALTRLQREAAELMDIN